MKPIADVLLDLIEEVLDDGKQDVVDAAVAAALCADARIKDLLDVLESFMDGHPSYEEWAVQCSCLLPTMHAFGRLREVESIG